MKNKEFLLFSIFLLFVICLGVYFYFTNPTKFVLECNQIDERLSQCRVIEPTSFSEDFKIMSSNICSNGTYIQSLVDCAKRSFYYADCGKISQEGENTFISNCKQIKR